MPIKTYKLFPNVCLKWLWGMDNIIQIISPVLCPPVKPLSICNFTSKYCYISSNKGENSLTVSDSTNTKEHSTETRLEKNTF